MISIAAIPGLPEISPGDDLPSLLTTAVAAFNGGGFADGDILVVSQKIVSKAEGRVQLLSEISPSERALRLAEELDRDPRQVEVILSESAEIVRAESGRLICRTHHGLVCANAGVDRSNTGSSDAVLLLPEDPDLSARQLRVAIQEQLAVKIGVIISDSFGRPWRLGQAEIAIGAAGVCPIDNWVGRSDCDGHELTATAIALIDEIASAADLVRTKTSREPAVLVRGLPQYVTAEDGPGAASVIREYELDLFR